MDYKVKMETLFPVPQKEVTLTSDYVGGLCQSNIHQRINHCKLVPGQIVVVKSMAWHFTLNGSRGDLKSDFMRSSPT